MICEKCNKSFKTITSENICYYCFVKKHGVAPDKKQYGGHKK